MSRTHRRKVYQLCALRRPKTYNEIKGLDRIKTADQLDTDHHISSRNRMPLPTSWDDKVASGHYQSDYNKPS